MENNYNAIIIQTIQLKWAKQKIKTGISEKKIYRQPINTRKDVQSFSHKGMQIKIVM